MNKEATLPRVRFGIVGGGAIGPTHAGALKQIPEAALLAVADLIPERAAAMAAKFGAASRFTPVLMR